MLTGGGSWKENPAQLGLGLRSGSTERCGMARRSRCGILAGGAAVEWRNRGGAEVPRCGGVVRVSGGVLVEDEAQGGL